MNEAKIQKVLELVDSHYHNGYLFGCDGNTDTPPPSLRPAIESAIRQQFTDAQTECTALRETEQNLREMLDACAPYLKDGETPAERIKRAIDDSHGVCNLLADARQRIAELEKQLEAARKDASRYQWLTENKHVPWGSMRLPKNILLNEGIDAAIDAAISKDKA